MAPGLSFGPFEGGLAAVVTSLARSIPTSPGHVPDQFAAVRLYDPVPGFNGVGGVTPATALVRGILGAIGAFCRGEDACAFDARQQLARLAVGVVIDEVERERDSLGEPLPLEHLQVGAQDFRRLPNATTNEDSHVARVSV